MTIIFVTFLFYEKRCVNIINIELKTFKLNFVNKTVREIKFRLDILIFEKQHTLILFLYRSKVIKSTVSIVL